MKIERKKESLTVRAVKSLKALNKCYLTHEVVEQVPGVVFRSVGSCVLTPHLRSDH